MPQSGTRSRFALSLIWLVLGLGMVVIPLWLGWTQWGVLLSGHPATLLAVIACALLGVVAIAWSVATLAIGGRQDREGDLEHPTRRTPQQLERRSRWRIILAIPALFVCVLLVSALIYSRPLAAQPIATSMLRTGDDVDLRERLTWYELNPVKKQKSGELVKVTTGLIFVPGAKVDSRAYAHLLLPLAQAGYLVVVLKEPFALAITQPGHPQTVIDAHSDITHWAVGGHSLGGVTASSFADTHPSIEGLVLYGSYPASTLERQDLKVLSVSASQDGLSTPAKVDAAKSKLPESTQYVVVQGASHATFGDYGPQPGDGVPSGDRSAEQAEIVKATSEFLASLTPPPPPKKKKK